MEGDPHIFPDTLTTPIILDLAFPPGTAPFGASGKRDWKVSVIAQGDEPRWIILGDTRKALPVLASWWPFKLSSRAQWSGVLLASFLNLLSRLPGIGSETFTIDAWYWRESLPDFSEGWTAVFHVGNQSHTRKAILFFVGQDGKVKAVAKVPLTAAAGSAILNEAAILRDMESVEGLPRVLFQDNDRGVAAQTWLEGKAVSRQFTPEHIRLLSSLANAGSTVRVSDFRAEIAASLDALDLPFDRSSLIPALDFLDYDQVLPAFVEHRDFAPWNLKRLPNGHLTLLDWEWAVEKSLPLQDICRFFYIQDALFFGPGKVWETLTSNPLIQEYMRRFEIPPAALPALTMYYLLRVLAMDSQNRNLTLTAYTLQQIESLLDHRRGRVGQH